MSYNGSLDFGLLADYDAVPDVAVLAEGIDRALARLLAAARGEQDPGAQAPLHSEIAVATEPPVPIVPTGARRARGPSADMRAKRGAARKDNARR